MRIIVEVDNNTDNFGELVDRLKSVPENNY